MTSSTDWRQRPSGRILTFVAVVLAGAFLQSLRAEEPAPGAAGTGAQAAPPSLPYPIVDTGQDRCYSDSREIAYPQPGQPFFGQDAQYQGLAPAYRDNGDGTVTDLVTGLMWSRAVDGRKVTLDQGERVAAGMALGGHTDWRVPTIKELYSLIDFRGYTGFAVGGLYGATPANAVPFIDTAFFDFEYGDPRAGERYIDAQWISCTKYVSTTMGGSETLFGVNFADGRIKGYGYRVAGGPRVLKTFYARYVRGPAYGENDFVDNGDGTVTDRATGLTWMQADSGRPMGWRDALQYAEGLIHAGHDDWRLPNAKELQSIVDYSRSPDRTGSPAIDPVFRTTSITNEAGQRDYPFFWTSTTHLDGPSPGAFAVYIAFGRALGTMGGRIMDVHGAGAQRSDPKSGQPQMGHGPQGDVVRVNNFVRCVRGGAAEPRTSGPPIAPFIQGQNPGLAPPAQGGFVARLDRDGDGRVSRWEFDGPPGQFDVLDRNRDGFLDENEAPRYPPPGLRPPMR
jgi:hypothetical protein